MLNFTKINIIIIYFIFIILGLFSLLNLQNNKNFILNKKVNLGLDLQGGSYLLLEIDTDSLIEEKIQDKVIPVKKFLKENKIKYQDFSFNNKKIDFKIDDDKIDIFESSF